MKKVFLSLLMLLMCVPAFAAGTNRFVKSSTGTLSSAVNYTPSITGKASIQSVTVHYDAATNEDIYIELDSELGEIYDTILATSDSVTLNDFFWQPDHELIIQKDDNIRVHIDSGAGAETYTITIRGEYR